MSDTTRESAIERPGYNRGVPSPIARLRRLVREGDSDAPGRVVDALGRVGLVGYGVVHLLVAWLAGEVAVGSSRGPADAGGAVGTVAATPGGGVLLVLLVVGLVTFALWQLVAAALGFRWVHGGERVRKRIGAVSKAIAMSGLAVAVAAFLAGSPGSGGDGSARAAAASLLAVPGGQVLLGATAAVLVAIAVSMTYTAVRRTFLGDLDLRHLGPGARQAVEWLGATGHLARALALGVVGALLGAAALSADATRAGGLDAALRTLGATVFGTTLLALVAAGFAAFGLFCFADAATRRA